MAHAPQLPDGMDVQEQRLDPDLISNRHESDLVPVSGLIFRNNVEQVTDPRTDISRYKVIAADKREVVKNLFSMHCMSPTLFRIPDTLICDRIYARDNEEAYYLDAMDIYFCGLPGDLGVNDLPILRRRLHSRMLCAFGRKPGYRSEHFERRRLRTWLCHDALENRHFSDAELLALHPKTEEWYEEAYIPPALAVPTPFVYYYYHNELRAAQVHPDSGNSERNRRMRFCGRKEHYIMAIAMWWNEVYYGGKLYILDNATIQVLEKECHTIPNIAGKPTQAILEHMKLAAQLPEGLHNWMAFHDGCMESSAFVFCVQKHGRVDYIETMGQKLYCDRLKRTISRTIYGSSIFKRVTVMDRRLTVPDLDKIQGLIGLVESHGWRAHGSLRVDDLLYHLLTLYRHTEERVGDCERELDVVRRELDQMHRNLDEKDRRLWDTESRLNETMWRLDDSERHLSEESRRLEEAKRRVNELPTPSPALRSAPIRQKRLFEMTNPYGPNKIRRNVTSSRVVNTATRTDNRNGKVQNQVRHTLRSPSFSPARSLVGDRTATLPNEEIDLKRPVAQSRASPAVLWLPPTTPFRSTTPARTGTSTTPARANTGNKVRVGYNFFRQLPSGNVPWPAKKAAKRRSHSKMNADTPPTVADSCSSTGATNTPSSAPEKGSRSDDGTTPRHGTESDPVLASLLERHPRDTAEAMRKTRRTEDGQGVQAEEEGV